MAIVKLLGSRSGRVIRIVAGLALITLGLAVVRGSGGVVMAMLGLLPLAAGVGDVCVLGPLFGLPFAGPRFRRAVEAR